MNKKDPSLSELKAALRCLEADIAKRVTDFQEETGIPVGNIQIDLYRRLNSTEDVVIRVHLEMDWL